MPKRKPVTFTSMSIKFTVGSTPMNLPYAVCDICACTILANQEEDRIKHEMFHEEMWDEIDKASKNLAVHKRGTVPAKRMPRCQYKLGEDKQCIRPMNHTGGHRYGQREGSDRSSLR